MNNQTTEPLVGVDYGKTKNLSDFQADLHACSRTREITARKNLEVSLVGFGSAAHAVLQVLREWRDQFDTLEFLSDTPQHHLELDEFALKSTGTSVSVDDVIAKIDAHLEDDDTL